jgi:O-antigen/teichoic acid export membrane protein
MSEKKLFVKGITASYIFIIASLITSLFLVPFVLKYLTDPEYGIFIIVGELIAWAGATNLGINATFNSKAAQVIGKKDFNELEILFNTAFYGHLLSSLILIVFSSFVYFNPEFFFDNLNEESLELIILFLLGGFYISYITQPLNSLLIADKQIDIDNYIKIGKLIVQTFLTVILLIFGYKLLALAISSLISNILMSFITIFRVKKSFSFLKLNFKKFSKKSFYYLLNNGIWFTLGSLAGVLIFRLDTILISKYISLSIVASYAINLKLFQIAEKFHGILFNSSRPYFAQSYGKKDIKNLSKMYNYSYYISIIFAFLIGIIIVIFSNWFISLWVGSNYYLGEKITLFLFVNFIIQSAVLPNRILLATTIYKVKIHNLSRVFDGILKIIIALALIDKFGIIGIISASIISSILFSNIVLNWLSSKLLKEETIIKLMPLLSVLSFLFIIIIENPLLRYLNYFLSSVLLFFSIYFCLNKIGYLKHFKETIQKKLSKIKYE